MTVVATKMTLVVFIVLLLGTGVHAEEREVEISATIDNEDIYIGDRINTNIVVENVENADVSFLEVPPDLGDFSFVESRPMEFGWRDKNKKGYIYVMGVYSTGMHVVPPISVRYRKEANNEWSVIESPQIPLTIKSTLTGKDTDIKDIKGLIYIRSISIVLFFLIALGLIVVAAIIFWIIAKRKEKLFVQEEHKKVAHEIAYIELDNLKREDLPGHGKTKEYYIKLSDIVRHYLENRFYFKAPEMTTEEFMAVAKRSGELEHVHKELLNDFLSRCDMVKFAKYGPTPIEMIDSFSSAERFVDQTKKVKNEEGEIENE